MKRIEFISFEEFRKLYKGAKTKKLKLCLLLGFGAGLRLSEIVGLHEYESRCCKIKPIQKRIPEQGRTVKKFFCPTCDKELPVTELVRSKTVWKIPPLEASQVNLETHQIRLDVAKGGKWRVSVTPPNLNKTHLTLLPMNINRRTLQQQFDRLTKKVLDKKMSFHILRHGFGNYQANVLKLPLPIVQQMMGHSRLDTTGIYTRVNPQYAIGESWKAMTAGE